MVRYNGRQKLLTSTLNTNQIGLKMSGTAPSVGTSISARRYTKRRVRDNLKFCGPVYYHGQLWSNNSGDSCVKKAPKNQSLAGGVGRINNPRTKCNIKCVSDKDYDTTDTTDTTNTTNTFTPININIENSDGSISALFGYLSFDMLNILNSNGSLPLSAAIPTPGNWYLANDKDNSQGGINASTFIQLIYTVKNSDELSRINSGYKPTLNGIKGETTIVSGTDNTLQIKFDNIKFEPGKTYTLSFQ